MIHVNKHKDGSVSVTELCPMQIVKDDDSSIVVQVQGMRRKPGSCLIYGTANINGKLAAVEFRIGDEDYVLGDLQPDSLAGWKIIFPNMEKDIFPKWAQEQRGTVESTRKATRAELPNNRYFRKAWIDNDTHVGIHMGKARDIHKDHLRHSRAPMLDDLDKQYMIADEKNDAKGKKAIADRKQKLRDVTDHPKIEAAATPEELMSLTIEQLLQ